MSNHTPTAKPPALGHLPDRPEWRGARPQRLFARLAPEPGLGAGVIALCDALPSAMPQRTLELVALRVSAELECLYVWRGHVRIALACGLSRGDIAGAAVGSDAFADAHDSAVLRGAEELMRVGRVSQATRTALSQADLAVTVATGAYQLIAALMADVAPEPGLPPVAGLSTPAAARATHATLACGEDASPDAT